MKFKRLISAAVVGTAFATSSAFAFPDREIKVVVPFTAGGPTDVVARTMAEAMRKHLNSPVVVRTLMALAVPEAPQWSQRQSLMATPS